MVEPPEIILARLEMTHHLVLYVSLKEAQVEEGLLQILPALEV